MIDKPAHRGPLDWLKDHWRRLWAQRHNHQFCRLEALNLATKLSTQAGRIVAGQGDRPSPVAAADPAVIVARTSPAADSPPIATIDGDVPDKLLAIVARIEARDDCGSSYPQLLVWQSQIYLAMPGAEREQAFLELCREFDDIAAAADEPKTPPAKWLEDANGAPPTDGERVARRDAAALALMSRIGQHRMAIAEKNRATDQVSWRLLTTGLKVVFFVLAEFAAIAGFAWVWPFAPVRPVLQGVFGLLMICELGVVGAFVSTSARLQKTLGKRVRAMRLKLADLDSLNGTGISVAISLWSGSVFALMAYFLFSSGVADKLGFKDGLFPTSAVDNAFSVSALAAGYQPHVIYPRIIEAGEHAPLVVTDLTAMPGQRTAAVTSAHAAAAGLSCPLASLPKAHVRQHGRARCPCGDGTPSGKSRNTRTSASQCLTPAALPTPVATPAALPTAMTTAVPVVYVQSGVSGAPSVLNGAPVEIACVDNAGPACGHVAVIAGRLGLQGAADLFKMLVWAFLAGFAERMLPDVIDRVLKRNLTTKSDNKNDNEPAGPQSGTTH